MKENKRLYLKMTVKTNTCICFYSSQILLIMNTLIAFTIVNGNTMCCIGLVDLQSILFNVWFTVCCIGLVTISSSISTDSNSSVHNFYFYHYPCENTCCNIINFELTASAITRCFSCIFFLFFRHF